MLRLAIFLSALLWSGCLVTAAMADTSTTVAVLPIYQAVQPFLLAIVTAAVPVLVTWALVQLQTRTNIHVNDQARSIVQQAAVNAAGRILAAQEGNLAHVSIDVGSPLVAAEIPKVQEAVGSAIGKLGMTPDRVGALIVGKIGQLQVQASAPTVVGPVVLPSDAGRPA